MSSSSNSNTISEEFKLIAHTRRRSDGYRYSPIEQFEDNLAESVQLMKTRGGMDDPVVNLTWPYRVNLMTACEEPVKSLCN